MTLLFLHGYSGSEKDFDDVPSLLAKRLRKKAKVWRLAGHRGGIEDLRRARIEDMLKDVLEKIDACKKPPLLIGNSLGGQLALLAAAEREVAGVVCVSAPHKMNFPFGFWAFQQAFRLIPSIAKRGPAPEGQRVFDTIPGNCMYQVRRARNLVIKTAPNVRCPVLVIGPRDEFLITNDAHIKLASLYKNATAKTLPKNKLHAPFYPPSKEPLMKMIEAFAKDIYS